MSFFYLGVVWLASMILALMIPLYRMGNTSKVSTGR